MLHGAWLLAAADEQARRYAAFEAAAAAGSIRITDTGQDHRPGREEWGPLATIYYRADDGRDIRTVPAAAASSDPVVILDESLYWLDQAVEVLAATGACGITVVDRAAAEAAQEAAIAVKHAMAARRLLVDHAVLA